MIDWLQKPILKILKVRQKYRKTYCNITYLIDSELNDYDWFNQNLIYSSSQIFPRTRGNGYLGNGISYDYQYEMATIPDSGIDDGQNVASE